MRAPHTPHLSLSLSAPRGDQRQPSATLHGAGQSCPAPTLPPSAHRVHRTAHTSKPPTPEREHQPTKQSRGKGRRDHTVPPPQASAPTPKAQTPKGEHTSSVNTKPQPPARGANTPTASLLFHHPREHKKRPHSNVWAQPSVSTGTRGRVGDRHERSADTRRGHADRRTQQGAQTTRVCVRCAPAPAREDSAREGRSQ